MILVYVTCRDRAEAERIAEHLLKKRLIAGANMFPIESMYWWKGKISGDNEFAILGKTVEEKFPEIKKEVKKIHSYEVPCILMWGAEADEDFLNWLRKEIK